MEYTQAYENSLHFSPQFQEYAESLARRLIERHDLYGKKIIDIGCGKGEFLALLCELGGNLGIGFDPSYVPSRTDPVTAHQITFIQDFYSEQYASYQADLICCRHVLEHLDEPIEFLNLVRRTLDDRRDTILFFEVPNMLFTLRDLGIWDIIYEHVSYFSPGSLARAFDSCGFDVEDLFTAYANQFLCIEAFPAKGLSRKASDRAPDLDQMVLQVAAFEAEYRHKVETWQATLEQIADTGQKAVIWGAGSKGVSFLNAVRASDRVAYAIDINPHKEGMHVAGTGQEIVRPEFLRSYQPDVVIVMNPIYQDEIRQSMDRLGVTAQCLVA
jgi:SAM-dependent methyltransferase